MPTCAIYMYKPTCATYKLTYMYTITRPPSTYKQTCAMYKQTCAIYKQTYAIYKTTDNRYVHAQRNEEL